MRRILPLLLLLGVACHRVPQEKAPVQPSQAAEDSPEVSVEITGQLRLIGSGPLTFLVVTGRTEALGSGDYRITGPMEEELRKLPLGPIRVKGRAQRIMMKTAGTSGRTLPWLRLIPESYQR